MQRTSIPKISNLFCILALLLLSLICADARGVCAPTTDVCRPTSPWDTCQMFLVALPASRIDRRIDASPTKIFYISCAPAGTRRSIHVHPRPPGPPNFFHHPQYGRPVGIVPRSVHCQKASAFLPICFGPIFFVMCHNILLSLQMKWRASRHRCTKQQGVARTGTATISPVKKMMCRIQSDQKIFSENTCRAPPWYTVTSIKSCTQHQKYFNALI